MIYKSNQIRILDPSITRKTAYEWLHFPTRFPKKEVCFFFCPFWFCATKCVFIGNYIFIAVYYNIESLLGLH